jgi:hypothetical protein
MLRPSRLATFGGIAIVGVLAALALHASVSDASTSELPAMTLSPGAANASDRMIIGVGIHRRTKHFDPARSDALTRQLGFTSIRDELGQSASSVRGGLDRTLAKGGALSSPARSANDANVFAVTGGGSGQFPNGIPLTDKERQSFYRFLTQLGPRMQSRPFIEIWNEWNLSGRLREAGSPESYAMLVDGAVPVLRKAFPGSKILAGSIGNDFDSGLGGTTYWNWTRTYLESGSWKKADGLSVHLYANCMKGINRQPIALIRRLRDLDGIIRDNNGGRSFPVYLTEVGWSGRRGSCGFDAHERAAFPAQFLIMAEALPFLRGVWLYELQDGQGDPRDTENSYGLVDARYRVKPETCPTRQAIALLRSYRVSGVKIVGGIATAALQSGSRKIEMAWSADGAAHQKSLQPGQQARALCAPRSTGNAPLRLTILPHVIYTGEAPRELTR